MDILLHISNLLASESTKSGVKGPPGAEQANVCPKCSRATSMRIVPLLKAVTPFVVTPGDSGFVSLVHSITYEGSTSIKVHW